MRRPPIRARVTAAFVVAMAAVLALTGVLIFFQFQASLDDSINDTLRQQADQLADSVPVDVVEAEGGGEGGLFATPTESFGADPLAAQLGSDGEIVAGSSLVFEALDSGVDVVDEPFDVVLPAFEPDEPEVPARLLVVPIDEAVPDAGFVAVGTTLEARADSLDNLRLLLVVGLTAALVLSSAAAYAVTSASLRPVEAMRRRAASISGRLRGERLPTRGSDDEIDRLGETMNELLSRVEASSERERSFLADASHELRTPLTTLRAELESVDRAGASEADLRQSVEHARQEATRLSRLAESLLTLARADAGELALEQRRVAIGPVADVVVERVAAGSDRSITVEVPDDLAVCADPRLIDTLIGALVENAVVHGGGAVQVRGRREGDQAVIEVADAGGGFPPQFLPHALERFARADESRSTPGTGLGLSIVAAIAAERGGRVEVSNGTTGGATVRVRLPLAE